MASPKQTRRAPGEASDSGKRDDLIKAAAELFDVRGYHAVSVAEIAHAAGLQKATLYHYFKSKDEILYWIHEEFVSDLLAKQKFHEERGLSPRELLFQSMVDILTVIRLQRGHVRVFFENFRELPASQRRRIETKRGTYQDAIERYFKAGIEAREFRAVDTRVASLAFFGMSNWSYQWYNARGPLTPAELADQFMGLLVDGLSNSHSG